MTHRISREEFSLDVNTAQNCIIGYTVIYVNEVSSWRLQLFDFTKWPDGAVSPEDSHRHRVTLSTCAGASEGTDGGALCRSFSRRHVTPPEVAVERACVERVHFHVDVNLHNSVFNW